MADENNRRHSGRVSSRPVESGSSGRVVAPNSTQRPLPVVPNQRGPLRTYQVINEAGVVVGHFADQVAKGQIVGFCVFCRNLFVDAFNVGLHDTSMTNLGIADGDALEDMPIVVEDLILVQSYKRAQNAPVQHYKICNHAGTTVGYIADHVMNEISVRHFSIFNQEGNFEDQVTFEQRLSG